MKQDNLSIPTYSSKPGLRKTWPAFLILAFTLTLTYFGWDIARKDLEAKVNNLFAEENQKIINKLSSGFDRQIEVLKSFQQLYKDRFDVVRDVFELFASVPFKMYDGMQSICYAPRILKGKEALFSETIWNEQYSNIKITPPGIRNEYYPIKNYIPLEKNSSLGAFDLLSNNVFKEAIFNARDNDQITISHLTKNICTKDSGFILATPIYTNQKPSTTNKERNENIKGVVFVELNSKTFINFILGKATDSTLVSFNIFSGISTGSPSLLYKQEIPQNPLRQTQIKLNIAGKEWLVKFYTNPNFGSNFDFKLPLYVLIAGIALSILLAGFTFSVLTSRSRAIDLAERITRSQRRIVDSSQEIICVVSFDGKIRSMNPASNLVLGFAQNEMIDNTLLSFSHPADKDKMHQTLISAPDEKPTGFESRFLSKSDETKWIAWSITSSNRDQMVYMIGKDITEEKKAEEQIIFQNKQLDLSRYITDRENYKNEEFLKSRSLEFRTELTSIMGFIEILMGDPTKFGEEEFEFLNLAYAGGQTLMSVVQQVLDVTYAKISDISFSKSPSKIDDIINQTEKILKPQADEKGINLLIKTPPADSPKVICDSKKLIESLVTLTNIIIESHTAGNLRLRATPFDEFELMEIVISDSGMKEAPEILRDPDMKPTVSKLSEKAFSAFIAKASIEVMSGTINMETNEEGFSITIKLPLQT